jgi:hypothetical protein
MPTDCRVPTAPVNATNHNGSNTRARPRLPPSVKNKADTPLAATPIPSTSSQRERPFEKVSRPSLRSPSALCYNPVSWTGAT